MRILVVHPDDSVATALVMMLRRAGLDVTLASELESAVEIHRRWHSDLVVLHTPPLPEPAQLQSLRGDDEVPVLALMGAGAGAPSVDTGFSAVLSRPFTQVQLLKAVGTLLRNYRQTRPARRLSKRDRAVVVHTSAIPRRTH